MKNMTSRQKILLGCFAMVMAIIGDFLLGFGTFSMTNDPNVPMGIAASVVPDWRYAASSLLGFLCVPFFAVAALELLKVMEKKYGLRDRKLYKLFRIANWSGILYFAFIHIGICMLPVVFNAGMEATGDAAASVGMMGRDVRDLLRAVRSSADRRGDTETDALLPADDGVPGDIRTELGFTDDEIEALKDKYLEEKAEYADAA